MQKLIKIILLYKLIIQYILYIYIYINYFLIIYILLYNTKQVRCLKLIQ